MKSLSQEQRIKYAATNEIAIVRDGIAFDLVTTDSLHYMTGVTKEIIELYVYFIHRVAISNGYRNDEENSIAPLVNDFLELMDQSYQSEFKFHLAWCSTKKPYFF